MNESNSSGGIEGSQISFFCHDKRNEPVVATCMKDGSWSPDPHTYKCQNGETREVTSKELSIKISLVKRYQYWHRIGSIARCTHESSELGPLLHFYLVGREEGIRSTHTLDIGAAASLSGCNQEID